MNAGVSGNYLSWLVRCAVRGSDGLRGGGGVQQESALSTFLFAVMLNRSTDEVRLASSWTVRFSTHGIWTANDSIRTYTLNKIIQFHSFPQVTVTMENAEKEKTDKSQHFPQTEPPRCRFFSQGKHCHFGKKCKFLHVRDDAAAQEKKSNRLPIHHEGTPVTSEACSEDVGHTAVAVHRRPCRYYLSGHCAMEDRCRFWHPTMFPTLDDTSVSSASSNQTRSVQRKPQVPRPAVLQEVKLCDLTEDVGQKLRETEIRQLMKRFPKDKVIIQERSDGKVTYYRMSVEATDPDWVIFLFHLVNIKYFQILIKYLYLVILDYYYT